MIGYGKTKPNTDVNLLIVEAKPLAFPRAGMPQLLVYMAGVAQAQTSQNQVNRSVFGILSDSDHFTFCLLDADMNPFTSKSFRWRDERSTVIAYIDTVMMSAIESSPHIDTEKCQKLEIVHNRGYPGLLEVWNSIR